MSETAENTTIKIEVGGLVGQIWNESATDVEQQEVDYALEDLESGLESLYGKRKRAVTDAMQNVRTAVRNTRTGINSDNSESRAESIDNALRNLRLAVEAEYSALETYVTALGTLPSKGPRRENNRPSHEMEMYSEWWSNGKLTIPTRLKSYEKAKS